MALISLAAVGIHDTVVRTSAVHEAVTAWQAGLLTAFFRTVLRQVFRKTQPALELDAVHRYGISPLQDSMRLV